MKQLLLNEIPKRKTFFGGTLLKKSHAKTARPLSTKNPIHLVLKSSKAKGHFSMLTLSNQRIVKRILKFSSYTFKIQVLEFSNNGNHLHLLIRGYNRNQIKNFIRTLSALLARYIQNKHKGIAKITSAPDNPQPFWDQRPFSRIVEGYKSYFVAKDYVILNHLESIGVVPYRSRKAYRSSD